MLAWHIGLRYLRTRRTAWLAVASICLTVAVPIVVLGVMQGFVDVTERQVRAAESDLVIQAPYAMARNAQLETALEALAGVHAVAPFTGNFAVMTPRTIHGDRSDARRSIGIDVEGVDWRADARIGRLKATLLHPRPVEDLHAAPLSPAERGTGFLTPAWRAHLAWNGLALAGPMAGLPVGMGSLDAPRPGAIVGRELLYGKLYGELIPGLAMRIIIPNGIGGTVGKDIVELSDTIGTGVLVFDQTKLVLPLAHGQRVTGMYTDDEISGYRIRLAPGADLDTTHQAVRAIAPLNCRVLPWQALGSRNLLESLRVQRRVLILIMIAIQALCVFIVFAVFSTLVAEKRHDIGVLLGLGARPRQVAGIFLLAGIIACGSGGLLGWLGGWAFLGLLNPLSNYFEMPLFPQDVLYTPEAPISWNIGYPLLFIAISCLVGLIATCQPALRAARIDPVHTLREHG